MIAAYHIVPLYSGRIGPRHTTPTIKSTYPCKSSPLCKLEEHKYHKYEYPNRIWCMMIMLVIMMR